MKKIFIGLLLLASCAPSMAATVVLIDNVDGTISITVTAASGNIVGLGLDIDVTGGQVTDVSIWPATFNIYPDAAQYEETEGDGYEYGEGAPIANQLTAGVATLPSADFAISAGMLNGETTAGADGTPEVVITFALDAPATICVSENALRGGIILSDGTGEDIDGTTVCSDIIPLTCRDVLPVDEQDDYDAYVAAGTDPSCWCCCEFQCRGDANCDTNFLGWRIYTTDLNRMAAAWKCSLPNPCDPCADFDHDRNFLGWRVYTGDLNILASNWKKTDSQLVPCPTYHPELPECQ